MQHPTPPNPGSAAAVALLLLLAGLLLPASSAAAGDAKRWIAMSMERLCARPALSGFDAQLLLDGSWLLEETAWPDPASPQRTTLRLALPDGGELTVERRAVGGQLRQFRAAYSSFDGERLVPAMQAIADGACTVQSARAMRAGPGAWRHLDQLDGDLSTLRWSETLQAPWPEGADPGGVRVAFVDSGLAYDLPQFRQRLARDANGTPLGYDFWDDDPWPYDGDVSRGAFFPIRHGTAVASIFVREAPEAAILPFRYPRPDMTRMADLVARASASGARILAMPLGSRSPDEWHAFEAALRTHDILAIVSAGNDGRDIDQSPVYPATLTAENLITVTSADQFGRLAQGSNWGGSGVDIMLPAENLEIVDFRGARGVASGSSYAVPRLAALAARILSDDPGLSTAELKAAIFARAAPSPFERDGAVAVGWIPDPLAD